MEPIDRQKARMCQEVKDGALAHLSDQKALEYLLLFTKPKEEVSILAKRLLEEFVSLAGVLDGEFSRVMQVEGIGESAAILLGIIPDIAAKYSASFSETKDVISHSWQLFDLFHPYFIGAVNEMTCLAAMDENKRVLGVKKISEGGPDNTDITMRQIIEATLTFGGKEVILAHNHMSGIAYPSRPDVLATKGIRDYLAQVDIVLYDHVILVDDDMVSLRDSNLMEDETMLRYFNITII